MCASPAGDAVEITEVTHVGGIGREDRWMALWVDVANRGKTEVVARLAAQGLALGPVTYTREIVLPSRSRLRVPLYARLRQSGTLEVVAWVDDEPVARYEQNAIALSAERHTVLVVDARGARLPFLVPRDDQGQPLLRVSIAPCTPGKLPSRWVGYDAFDLVVLHDVTASALSPRQREALVNWVKSGGTVVAFVGRFAAQYRDPFFERILGVRVSGSVPAAELNGLIGPDGQDIEVAGLRMVVAQTERDTPRSVLGRRIDCGRSVFVAFDASAAGELSKPCWQRQWLRLITARNPSIDWTRLEAAVLRSLEQLSGYRTPGLGTVWLAIGSFFVLAVPLNYHICRRRGRLEWAWVVMSVLAIGFALGAHAMGLSSRGLAAKRTAISFVQAVEHARTARATTFVAVYSPVAGEVRCGLTDGSAAISPVEELATTFRTKGGRSGPALSPDDGPWDVQQSDGMALHAPVARPASFTWCRVDHLMTLPEPFEMDFEFSGDRITGWMDGGAPWRPAVFRFTGEFKHELRESGDRGRWRVVPQDFYDPYGRILVDLPTGVRPRSDVPRETTSFSQRLLAKPLLGAVVPTLGKTVGLVLRSSAPFVDDVPPDRAVSWLFVAPTSLRSAQPQTALVRLPVKRAGVAYQDGVRGYTRLDSQAHGLSIRWYRDATIVCRGTVFLPGGTDPAQRRRLIVHVSSLSAPGYAKMVATLPCDGQPLREYGFDLAKPRQSGSAIEISIPAEHLPVTYESGTPSVDLEVRFEKTPPPSPRYGDCHLTLAALLEVEIPPDRSDRSSP